MITKKIVKTFDVNKLTLTRINPFQFNIRYKNYDLKSNKLIGVFQIDNGFISAIQELMHFYQIIATC
jgi:hypothetical protein